jgi:hypothetical protein
MNDNVSLPVSSDQVTSELCQQACPECGGVMKAVHLGNLIEYTCHVGHRLGAKTMIVQKSDVIERSMWNAVCQTEELLDLLRRERPQDPPAIETLNAEISQRQKEIETLKNMLRRERISSLAS